MWRSVVYPYLHYILVLGVTFVAIGGPLYLLRRLVGNPFPPLAYATLAIYAITLLYVLHRLWLFQTSKAVRDAATDTYSSFRVFELVGLCHAVVRADSAERRRCFSAHFAERLMRSP